MLLHSKKKFYTRTYQYLEKQKHNYNPLLDMLWNKLILKVGIKMLTLNIKILMKTLILTKMPIIKIINILKSQRMKMKIKIREDINSLFNNNVNYFRY